MTTERPLLDGNTAVATSTLGKRVSCAKTADAIWGCRLVQLVLLTNGSTVRKTKLYVGAGKTTVIDRLRVHRNSRAARTYGCPSRHNQLASPSDTRQLLASAVCDNR